MNRFETPYSRVSLPTIDPIVNEQSLMRTFEVSDAALHFWQPYVDSPEEVQALQKSILEVNIDNALKHSRSSPHGTGDASRAAQSPRPHAALFHAANDGFGGVEISASLPSSEEEPHNALTRLSLRRGAMLLGAEWQPVSDLPRTRIKVTRYFPENERTFAVVSTKVDQHGVRDEETGYAFGIKARRSGYVVLDEIDTDARKDFDTLVSFLDHEPESPSIDIARRGILELLASEQTWYQAVVDRIYATRE